MVDKTGVTFYRGAFVDVIKTVNRSGVWCMILTDADRLITKNYKVKTKNCVFSLQICMDISRVREQDYVAVLNMLLWPDRLFGSSLSLSIIQQVYPA